MATLFEQIFGNGSDGVGGLLGNPAFMVGSGLLSNHGNPWAGALQGLAAAQGYKLSEAKMKKEAEQEQRLAEAQQMQMKALQDAQKRQETTQGLLTTLNIPEVRAAYSTPEMQAVLRPYVVANADPAALEQAGVLAPIPTAQEEPSIVRTIRAMGGDPQDPNWQRVIMHSILRPKSQVNVNNATIPPPPSGYYYPVPGDYSTVVPQRGGPHDPAASKEGREQASNIARVDQALDNYRQAVATVGTKVIPGPEKLRLSSSHTDLLMEMKELYNLGVLNGPDYELMLGVIKDPTSVWTVGQGYTGKDLLKQLDSVVVPKLEAAKRLYKEKYGRPFDVGVGTAAPDATTPSAPVKSLADMTDAELEAELRRLEGAQ